MWYDLFAKRCKEIVIEGSYIIMAGRKNIKLDITQIETMKLMKRYGRTNCGSIMGISAKLNEDFNGYQLLIKVYGKRKERWNSCNIGFGKDEQKDRASAEKFAAQANEAIKVWNSNKGQGKGHSM